ncbi:hypothetical protein [Natranaerofaba carboxydovora]|nr:hypothetical protein [Natranaerofaba carboxydovora]
MKIKKPRSKLSSKHFKLLKWYKEEIAMPSFDMPVRGWWSNNWRLK